VDSNSVLDVIKSMRTVHWNFKDKPVSNEDIETIIEHGLRAANSDNLIDYSIVVVKDPKTLNIISGGESKGTAATCLIYAVDHSRIIKCARELGYENFKPSDRLYNFFISLADVFLAAQTAVIAAKSMGIDSQVTNFSHRKNPSEMMKLLGMPEKYCFPVIQVILGYSDEKPRQKRNRISKEHIIHYEKYRSLDTVNTDEIIREMDEIYPERISEKYTHTMDWYFNEWIKEWYTEEIYGGLNECLRRSKLVVEPNLKL
jgi:nitroreductase